MVLLLLLFFFFQNKEVIPKLPTRMLNVRFGFVWLHAQFHRHEWRFTQLNAQWVERQLAFLLFMNKKKTEKKTHNAFVHGEKRIIFTHLQNWICWIYRDFRAKLSDCINYGDFIPATGLYRLTFQSELLGAIWDSRRGLFSWTFVQVKEMSVYNIDSKIWYRMYPKQKYILYWL